MKLLSQFFLLLILFFSCKREEVNFLGPAYVSAPKGFHVTSFVASTLNVDFSTGTVVFEANFSHSVTWILTITGQQSGAVKEFKGISDGFTNLLWTGSHDGVAFFRNGEVVNALLSFYGTSYTSALTVSINRVADYTTCGLFPRYADFETPSRVKTPNWSRFDVAEQGVDSMAVDYNGNIVPSVQGKCYYYMRGLGQQSVFVDGIQYIGALTPALPKDADNVWVNVYIYGTGNTNTAVDLEYQEADFDGSSAGYSGTDDDAFVAHVNVNHKGWKLFSFRYSSLVPSANADFGGSGNKIHEPDRLKSFDIILLKKSDPNSPVEVYFDYPIITVGGPFKPCK